MIKTLKGHPHNYSQLELKDIDNLSKKQFLKGTEIVEEEEILEELELELEERIKKYTKSVSGLRIKPTLRE